MSVCYPRTTALWPNDGVIKIKDKAGHRDHPVAIFSCEFLEKGHVLTWAYILEVCHAVIGKINRGKLYKTAWPTAEIDMKTTPSPGTYYFLPSYDPSRGVTFALGPRLFDVTGEAVLPNDETASERALSPSRSDIVRTKIITPEIYTEVLGRDYLPGFHDPAYEITLRHDIRCAWRFGKIGFYPVPKQPNVLIIHVFAAGWDWSSSTSDDNTAEKENWLKVLHGRKIYLDDDDDLSDSKDLDQAVEDLRLHNQVKGQKVLPNRKLLQFHYEQCCMKHHRGFAWKPIVSFNPGPLFFALKNPFDTPFPAFNDNTRPL